MAINKTAPRIVCTVGTLGFVLKLADANRIDIFRTSMLPGDPHSRNEMFSSVERKSFAPFS